MSSVQLAQMNLIKETSNMLKDLFLAALCLFFFPAYGYATSPDDVLREMVGKMKEKNSPSVVVDYVQWDEAFANLAPKHREQMRVNSPQEMKEFYRQVLANPLSVMKSQLQEQTKSIPVEKKAEYDQYMMQMEQRLTLQQQELGRRIQQTTYEIGTAVVEGNTARVKLKQTFDGKSVEEEVKFVKAGDTWLLPSVSSMNPAPRPPQRAKNPPAEAPPVK
jgi:hypothetical protein